MYPNVRQIISSTLNLAFTTCGVVLVWWYIYSIGSSAISDHFHQVYQSTITLCGTMVGITIALSQLIVSRKPLIIADAAIYALSLTAGVVLAHLSWKAAVLSYLLIVMVGHASTSLLAGDGSCTNLRCVFGLRRVFITLSLICIQLALITSLLLPVFRHERALQQIDSFGGHWGLTVESGEARSVVAFSGRDFGDSELAAVIPALLACNLDEVRLDGTSISVRGNRALRRALPASTVVTHRNRAAEAVVRPVTKQDRGRESAK